MTGILKSLRVWGGGGEGGRVSIWNFLKGWTKVYSLKMLTLWT